MAAAVAIFFLSLSAFFLINVRADTNSYSRCLNSGDPRVHPAMIRFTSPELSVHNWCEDLSRTECNQYPEAVQKCKCLCDELNNSGKERYRTDQNSNNNNNNNNNPNNNNNNNNGDNSRWRPDKTTHRRRGCFHGDDEVSTEIGVMKISDLFTKNKNAKVLSFDKDSGKVEFSPIVYWLHAEMNKTLDYLILSTENNGPNLHISHKHLIYVSDCSENSPGKSVFAENARIGDCIWVNDEGQSSQKVKGHLQKRKVVGIRQELKLGLYAPITENGNILVNNVLASCYTNYENEEIQKYLFSFVLSVKKFATYILPKYFWANDNSYVEVPEFVFSFLDMSNLFVSK